MSRRLAFLTYFLLLRTSKDHLFHEQLTDNGAHITDYQAPAALESL